MVAYFLVPEGLQVAAEAAAAVVAAVARGEAVWGCLGKEQAAQVSLTETTVKAALEAPTAIPRAAVFMAAAENLMQQLEAEQFALYGPDVQDHSHQHERQMNNGFVYLALISMRGNMSVTTFQVHWIPVTIPQDTTIIRSSSATVKLRRT